MTPFPPFPPTQTLIQHILLQQSLQMQAPAPLLSPTRQVVTPTEWWGAVLRSLLQICKALTCIGEGNSSFSYSYRTDTLIP